MVRIDQCDFDAEDLLEAVVGCGLQSERFDFALSYTRGGFQYASNGFFDLRLKEFTNENTFDDDVNPPLHNRPWHEVGEALELERDVAWVIPEPSPADGRLLSYREQNRAPVKVGEMFINADFADVLIGAGGRFHSGPYLAMRAGDVPTKHATVRVVGDGWDAIVAPCGDAEQSPVFSFRRLLRLRKRFSNR